MGIIIHLWVGDHSSTGSENTLILTEYSTVPERLQITISMAFHFLLNKILHIILMSLSLSIAVINKGCKARADIHSLGDSSRVQISLYTYRKGKGVENKWTFYIERVENSSAFERLSTTALSEYVCCFNPSLLYTLLPKSPSIFTVWCVVPTGSDSMSELADASQESYEHCYREG